MLLDLIEKHQKVGLILKTHHPDILHAVLSASPLDPLGVNYVHESIYLAAHGLTSRPRCLVCGEVERRFHNIKKGYVPTCPTCKGKSAWRKEKFRTTCLQRFGSTTPAGNSQVMNQIAETKIKRGQFKTPEERGAYKQYSMLVHGLTQKQPLHLLENFHLRGKNGKPGAYQVDHEFSIYDAFRQGVAPEIVAHITNLRMIPAIENRKKWHRSTISITELQRRILEHEN